MSEAMAVETIVEAYWRLMGYWTKLRFPFQTTKGGWSDVDLLAYNPEEKTLVISESKVKGPKNWVFAYTKQSKEKYGDIFAFDQHQKYSYFSFLNNIRHLCAGKKIFQNFEASVERVVVQLVSNYYITEEMLAEVAEAVRAKVKRVIPKGIAVDVRLETTFEVICEIIRLERAKDQGRRYGHPVIDIVRELNRYLHPAILKAGKSKKETLIIKDKFRHLFEEAL